LEQLQTSTEEESWDHGEWDPISSVESPKRAIYHW
jgi:hypothetical protein